MRKTYMHTRTISLLFMLGLKIWNDDFSMLEAGYQYPWQFLCGLDGCLWSHIVLCTGRPVSEMKIGSCPFFVRGRPKLCTSTTFSFRAVECQSGQGLYSSRKTVPPEAISESLEDVWCLVTWCQMTWPVTAPAEPVLYIIKELPFSTRLWSGFANRWRKSAAKKWVVTIHNCYIPSIILVV